MHTLIVIMAVIRIAIGLGPFIAAAAVSRALGIPPAHDNATARLFARLFAVREFGLGAIVLWGLGHQEALVFALLLNACMDAGDCVSLAIPLLERQGIDRAALLSGAAALGGGVAWLVVAALVR